MDKGKVPSFYCADQSEALLNCTDCWCCSDSGEALPLKATEKEKSALS